MCHRFQALYAAKSVLKEELPLPSQLSVQCAREAPSYSMGLVSPALREDITLRKVILKERVKCAPLESFLVKQALLYVRSVGEDDLVS